MPEETRDPSEAERAEAKLAELETSLRNATEIAHAHVAALSRARNDVALHERRHHSNEIELTRLREQLGEMRARLEATPRTATPHASAQEARLREAFERELAERDAALQDAQRECAALRAEVTASQAANDASAEQVRRLEAELAEARQSVTDRLFSLVAPRPQQATTPEDPLALQTPAASASAPSGSSEERKARALPQHFVVRDAASHGDAEAGTSAATLVVRD